MKFANIEILHLVDAFSKFYAVCETNQIQEFEDPDPLRVDPIHPELHSGRGVYMLSK